MSWSAVRFPMLYPMAASLVWVLASCATLRSHAPDIAQIATPPEIVEQPRLRSVSRWGEQLAVFEELGRPVGGPPLYRLWTLDVEQAFVHPFEGLNCSTISDVGYSEPLGMLLLCGREGKTWLYRRTGLAWEAVGEPVPGLDFRLAVDRDQLVVIAPDRLLVDPYRPGSQVIRLIPEIGGYPAEPVAPDSAVLADGLLVLGYDHGEFGGGVYLVDLDQSGVKPMRIDQTVTTLARSSAGAVWGVTGSTFGMSSGAVYRIGRAGIEVVSAMYAAPGPKPGKVVWVAHGVQFPGRSDIGGLTIDADDRPIILFSRLGIFALATDRFELITRGIFALDYSMPEYTVGSAPVGLVFSRSGELVVGTRSLGLLILRKGKRGYVFGGQVLFPASTTGPTPLVIGAEFESLGLRESAAWQGRVF